MSRITTTEQADSALVAYMRTLAEYDGAPAEQWDHLEGVMAEQIERIQASGYSDHIDAIDVLVEQYNSADFAELAELLEAGKTTAARIASGTALSV